MLFGDFLEGLPAYFESCGISRVLILYSKQLIGKRKRYEKC